MVTQEGKKGQSGGGVLFVLPCIAAALLFLSRLDSAPLRRHDGATLSAIKEAAS